MDALCVVRAKPVSTTRNPPPPSTQAPKLPDMVRDVTPLTAQKLKSWRSNVGRQQKLQRGAPKAWNEVFGA